MSGFSDPPIAKAVYAPSGPSAPVFVPSSSASTIDPLPAITSLHPSFPPGLLSCFARSSAAFSERHWIVDNSGSMATADGREIVEVGGRHREVPCTRWQELTSSLTWHGSLSANTLSPVTFRLLNNPGGGADQTLSLGLGDPVSELDRLRRLTSSTPCSTTPLCRAIASFHQHLLSSLPSLTASGTRALLVIASDGASSDGDVAAALRPLRDLPVWVVVRLCTDDDSVVDYWNSIDNELELDMDVLDDLSGEAKEITDLNPWLNYGLPLHRLREWGAVSKEFDLLDERAFNSVEVQAILKLLLGVELPHPEVDYDEFEAQLVASLKEVGDVYDPLKKRMAPWVDVGKLRRSLGKGGCVIS